MAGLYLHIPFCAKKCIYCDFYSVGVRLADWSAFVDALLDEVNLRIGCDDARRDSDHGFKTIYIGGGTPSLMPDAEFLRLTEGLLSVVPHPVEFTIEVNPDDVTSEKVMLWADSGVNRVSMGVQSLVDSELRAIGRRHNAEMAFTAYELLKSRFKNISLDLMFGLPGQTLESLTKTLNGFSMMKPVHVAAYSLMYEERTPLTVLRDKGTIQETGEDDALKMFAMISSVFKLNGYSRYEISNYARPGFESVHNTSYWRGVSYIGIGPGAHSYDGERTRRANLPDLKAYLSRDKGADAPNTIEILDDNELREEMILTRLRTSEGIDLNEFEDKFGCVARNEIERSALPFLESGQVIYDDSKLYLSDSGVMVSDDIMVSLF